MARDPNTKMPGRPPKVPAAVKSAGGTAPRRTGSAYEQLPHDRDESTNTQQPSPDGIGNKAFEDASSERADTSMAPVTDSTYRKLKQGG